MNKTLLLVLTGTLALSAEGCSYMSEFVEQRKEIENPPTISTSVQAEASEKDPEAQAELAETPEKEGVSRTQDVAGLIPSTNPDVRIRGNVRGRKDPFAVVSLTPTIQIKEDPKTTNTNRTQANTNRNNRNQNNNRSRVLPPPRVRRPEEITSTPTIDTQTVENSPKADLAENVLITGLVQLGDRIQIILQAPEETSSRYVEVGQYVSNGKVLVKRIETSFPTPVVILEQAGIEVAKAIGQTKDETTEQTTSFLPSPPPVSSSNSLSWLSEKNQK
ncbi:MAG: hypothetical protein QNJ32_07660 [Xenococcaceae cyanobacterium MO_167.B27]|nr:hypothetical protein [Xenococcaceae cyanobacterium MO_167.B27]